MDLPLPSQELGLAKLVHLLTQVRASEDIWLIQHHFQDYAKWENILVGSPKAGFGEEEGSLPVPGCSLGLWGRESVCSKTQDRFFLPSIYVQQKQTLVGNSWK